MARRHHLKIDGKTVLDMKNLWLPPTASAIVGLKAGTYPIEAELEKEDNPSVYYKKVTDETVFRPPVAEAVDYTVFAGNADEVIVSYRQTTGEVYRNVYPLIVNKTVYEGSRRDVPGKRVMLLTRSGFPGMQRYATVTWSGDVGYDWETLRRQIVGGLGMVISGQPWWTYDAGGFFRPGQSQYTDPAYHECFLHWLQACFFR